MVRAVAHQASQSLSLSWHAAAARSSSGFERISFECISVLRTRSRHGMPARRIYGMNLGIPGMQSQEGLKYPRRNARGGVFRNWALFREDRFEFRLGHAGMVEHGLALYGAA